MVGILVSFWEGLFSGAMLVSGRVPEDPKHIHIWVLLWHVNFVRVFVKYYDIVWVDPMFTKNVSLSYFLRVRRIVNFPRQFEFFQVHFIMFEIHNLRPQPLECWVRESWESNEKCIQKSSRIHPGRLTWNIIMEVWKIMFLSKWVICRFHVNLPGCKCNSNLRPFWV